MDERTWRRDVDAELTPEDPLCEYYHGAAVDCPVCGLRDWRDDGGGWGPDGGSSFYSTTQLAEMLASLLQLADRSRSDGDRSV